MKMTQEIKEVVEGIQKNIKLLEEVEQINFTDVRNLLIMVFGIFKDLFERFEYIFEKVETIKKIENSTKKGEDYEEKISYDVERFYQ